jgi:cyclopropane fatty-acyl-phospholipid synthase-like methyltransferase
MENIYKHLDDVMNHGTFAADYWEKMMHQIPEANSVDRYAFLIEVAKGRRVLDIGCTGPLSEAIAKIAEEYYGIDRVECPAHCKPERYWQTDLDNIDVGDPIYGKAEPYFDCIIASEVIEHLGNPGLLLAYIKTRKCPIILTAPNAFSSAGQHFLRKGYEQVNKDHVAWYSWHTLKTLVERYGYNIIEWYWYNGKPYTAEGIIFVME